MTDPRDGCQSIATVQAITVEVIEIDVADERLWLRPEDSEKHIAGHVAHVDPNTELGEALGDVEVGMYLVCSMTRYQRGSEYMPFWCIESIQTVREPTGAERNVLTE